MISETKKGVLIEVVARPRVTLDALLKTITKDTVHSELDWGASVGKEIRS